MSFRRKCWAFLGVAVGLLLLVFLSCVEKVPKKDLTFTAINSVSLEINRYYQTNHHLPPSLAALNIAPQSLSDGWGRRIVYTVTNSNRYVLKSLGPGGKPGEDNTAYSFDPRDVAPVPLPAITNVPAASR